MGTLGGRYNRYIILSILVIISIGVGIVIMNVFFKEDYNLAHCVPQLVFLSVCPVYRQADDRQVGRPEHLLERSNKNFSNNKNTVDFLVK